MIHLGDITKISGYTAPIVDVVVGGSPCQDLSVAGKRAGLDGERSGLFMEQLRIIKEMRERDKRNGATDDIRPRYMVWENVPGAFSSNKAEDFRIVLEETVKVKDPQCSIPMPDKGKWTTAGCILGDGWSIAWRVLDAQFWGVPQRRRRIALIADFGGHSAPEILFVRKSLSGDTEQSKPQRKDPPTNASRGIGADDIFCIDGDKLNKKERKGGSGIGYRDGDKQYTLTAKDVHGVAYTLQDREGKAGGGKGALIAKDLSATLRAGFAQTLFQPVHCIDQGGGKSACNVQEGQAPTLTCTHGGEPAVCYSVENHPADSRVNIDESGKVQTLTSRMGTGGGNVPMVMTEAIGVDCYNLCETGQVGRTLATSSGGLNEHIPVVMECYSKSKRAQSDTDYETWKESNVANTLNAFDVGDKRTTEAVVQCLETSFFTTEEDLAHTLKARDYKDPSIVTYVDTSDGDIAGTLDASYYKGCGLRQGRERTVVVKAFPEVNYNQFRESNNELATLKAKGGTCGDGSESLIVAAVDCRNGTENSDVNGTLQSHMSGGSFLNLNNVVRVKYIVRRLTPLECERLQGYPDGWTDIGEYIDSNGKKKQSSDAARYKALGNSIALPPWKWVMKRLSACYERDATLASLFDGIGGFPLIWEQINGKGTCLWASEIEDFPIAVTKARIGE